MATLCECNRGREACEAAAYYYDVLLRFPLISLSFTTSPFLSNAFPENSPPFTLSAQPQENLT